jgi:hypothetical protein
MRQFMITVQVSIHCVSSQSKHIMCSGRLCIVSVLAFCGIDTLVVMFCKCTLPYWAALDVTTQTPEPSGTVDTIAPTVSVREALTSLADRIGLQLNDDSWMDVSMGCPCVQHHGLCRVDEELGSLM